ncbi:uncharacterized protein LOC127810998 isoform X2 [Diospyros lotus]|uniref:uncharacterized protein LOC127810998 isoform X2 n=1 Tax=Diospyros lotus TaxID=55363 RepID=UPI002255F7CC|nr:uncharacterized protein LOC127810998 isoform X2 [Diospyros lotus]
MQKWQATRENIVTNTIQYIKSLEKEIERLESLKNSPSPPPQSPCPARPALTHYANRSSSVNVTFSGGRSVAFFGIQVAARRRVVSEILRVFGKHEAEVLAAAVSSRDEGQQQRRLELTVTAVLGGDADKGERIKHTIINLEPRDYRLLHITNKG